MKFGTILTSPAEKNTRIKLKNRIVTAGTGRFQKPIYTTIAAVWAKWVGVHGSESWMANSMGAMRAATVTIDYRSDIDETCVVEKDGDDYEIKSMDNIRNRNIDLELKVQLIKAG